MLFVLSTGVSGNLKKVAVFSEDQTTLLPAVGTVVTMEVSCVRSPSHFYAVLPWGPHSVEEVASNSEGLQEIFAGAIVALVKLQCPCLLGIYFQDTHEMISVWICVRMHFHRKIRCT